jgi:hypothetical protein
MSCTVHADCSNAPQAAELIEGLPAEVVMADTASDADHLRQAIAAKGALAVIPNNPSRALKYPPPRRNPRFEKSARNYLAVVTLAAIILWMR